MFNVRTISHICASLQLILWGDQRPPTSAGVCLLHDSLRLLTYSLLSFILYSADRILWVLFQKFIYESVRYEIK